LSLKFKIKNMSEKVIFKIEGMDCTSCAKIIKYGLEEVEGISFVDVDFNSAKVSVEFDSTKTDLFKIKNKIKDLGYKIIEEQQF